MFTKSFPFYYQLDAMDCGPTCLRMVAKYYGLNVSLEFLRNKTEYNKIGVSLLGLAETAESLGLKTLGSKLSFDQLINEVPLPAILHWNQSHYVVLLPKSNYKKITIADPTKGKIKLSKDDFLKNWTSTNDNGIRKGIALLIEPSEKFKEININDKNSLKNKIGWYTLFGYVKLHKVLFLQVLIGLLIGSILQLFFPYLTQIIVDTGINTQNLSFIQIILAAQLMLLFSQTIIEFIRSRILLHISTHINISLLNEFWAKLLKLPMSFFDRKHPGDIIQRIEDHQRIQNFLTGSGLNIFFSLINLVVFSFVMITYDLSIFIVFALGSILYLLWIRLFLKHRRQLDYRYFYTASKENNATMQLVNGMQEIKLNNAEQSFRWAWAGLQAELFKLSFKNLSLNQYQQIGAFFINQGKNIIITFLVAKLVIDGKLTLGAMMAIQFIVGQLNGPIEQLIGFTQQAQDAKISLERLNDIHTLEDEEPFSKEYSQFLPKEHSIQIKDLSFTYLGAGNEPVLKNINLDIPQGKITAIVGMSGSGKTTLLKLLLKFYENYKGSIHIGNENFKTISPKFWRSISGSVMQDNFIFNDNIDKNIAVSDEKIDNEKLLNACKITNILTFIESLPMGFQTKLGAEGVGISGGQKQRICIARAIYKNPDFIFFDEATNTLDANNEILILENLQKFFEGKTVIVVAHRLSTVKKADNIVVLENGEIAENGTHKELIKKKGKYFELVKNQLELGNE